MNAEDENPAKRIRTDDSDDINARDEETILRNNELQEKISSFLEEKQSQIDASNQREFVVRGAALAQTDTLTTETCARTAPIPSRKSQIKLTRALADVEAPFFDITPDVDERLKNMEAWVEHRGASLPTPVPKNVYVRLKQLEDRILALEERGIAKLDKRRKYAFESTGSTGTTGSAATGPSAATVVTVSPPKQTVVTGSGRKVTKASYAEHPVVDPVMERMKELKAKLKAKQKALTRAQKHGEVDIE